MACAIVADALLPKRPHLPSTRAQILAVKSTTYYLGEVPHLHSLVESMTSRQLAHFARVLALVVFEPEFRQLMESAHVFKCAQMSKC